MRFVLLMLLFVSCGPRTGIHEENDVKPPIVPDTGVVSSISLTSGKYQKFRVSVRVGELIKEFETTTISYNVNDSVIIYGSYIKSN